VTDVEKRMVRAILVAARVGRQDADWMAESCPSVARAREIYARGVSAGKHIELPTSDWYVDVHAARQAVIAAQDSGDLDRYVEAVVALTVAVETFQMRLDSVPSNSPTDASAPLPPNGGVSTRP
jgi:hypothetical protein